MGFEQDREAPWYFTKPATAIVLSGATIPYPPETANYHYEMELVVALGAAAHAISVDRALDAVYGYAAGMDMTRRDQQIRMREKSRPWDLGKAFEQSAIIGPIRRRDEFGQVRDQRITLIVDGQVRQDARLSDMVWSVPEIVCHLSRFYHLGPGDFGYAEGSRTGSAGKQSDWDHRGTSAGGTHNFPPSTRASERWRSGRRDST
jgi:fumarylpyruvate hydrolase